MPNVAISIFQLRLKSIFHAQLLVNLNDFPVDAWLILVDATRNYYAKCNSFNST